MITIAELFPCYSTAIKWYKITRNPNTTVKMSSQEKIRLQNSYTADGKIFRESWYFMGKLHRAIGPACVEYYKSG